MRQNQVENYQGYRCDSLLHVGVLATVATCFILANSENIIILINFFDFLTLYMPNKSF